MQPMAVILYLAEELAEVWWWVVVLQQRRNCHNDVLVLLSGQVCVLKNWVEKEGKHDQQKWALDPEYPQHCRLFPVLPTLTPNHIQRSFSSLNRPGK